MKQKDTHIIQSLDKGLRLLESVEAAAAPVSLKDLTITLGWDKATIHRLLLTLERRGYLLRDPSSKRYILGLKIFGLYDALAKNFDIQEVTRPSLSMVSRKTGESAHLAVSVGKEIVFIDRVTSSETLSVNTQIGAREPLFCTALGRAILAFLPDEELAPHLPDPLARYTQRTITDVSELRKRLRRVRERGFAIDNGEYLDGIRCIAAPIFNHDGVPIAAMGISGPRNRISLEKANLHGQLIRRATIDISRRAGWRGGGSPARLPA
jgi:DNA-binding IclR family transcriptional regulator